MSFFTLLGLATDNLLLGMAADRLQDRGSSPCPEAQSGVAEIPASVSRPATRKPFKLDVVSSHLGGKDTL